MSVHRSHGWGEKEKCKGTLEKDLDVNSQSVVGTGLDGSGWTSGEKLEEDCFSHAKPVSEIERDRSDALERAVERERLTIIMGLSVWGRKCSGDGRRWSSMVTRSLSCPSHVLYFTSSRMRRRCS